MILEISLVDEDFHLYREFIPYNDSLVVVEAGGVMPVSNEGARVGDRGQHSPWSRRGRDHHGLPRGISYYICIKGVATNFL